MNMELQGTFDTFPLSELLEMMQHSSMCGVLEVEGVHGHAAIWTRDGVICHAEYAGERGKPAIMKLFGESSRPFLVRADKSHPWGPPGLGDAQTLIEQAQTYQKTWGEIHKRLPNLDLVPVVRKQPQKDVKLNDLDWAVFMAINGEYTVRQLTEPTVLDLLDVCRSVIRLNHIGVIELVDRGRGTQASVSEVAMPAQSTNTQGQGGLIKRKPGIGSSPKS